MPTKTIFRCENCGETHNNSFGMIGVDTIGVMGEEDTFWGEPKEGVYFCNKECLKAWIDKEL